MSSFAKVYSAQTTFLSGNIIDVETDLGRGLYAFSVVGLPDKAVEESKDRISAAIKNSGFLSPKEKNQKTVVSLAPADLKKEGPFFDVAIALSYLLAAGHIDFDPNKKMFVGELALDGKVRSVKGILPLIEIAKRKKFSEVFVPKENAEEAALIRGIKIYGVSNLKDLILHLDPSVNKSKDKFFLKIQPQTKIDSEDTNDFILDFSDIRGQESAKRGLLIAAAGGHNIAMYGPPGTGKTMLAKAFTSILPSLSFDEALEVTSIHSVAGILKSPLITKPPLRSPHHSASYVAVVGGGVIPKPGEITLAHRGVLFLDEFPEFDRRVIDVLREPLEERSISISRARGSSTFPASFILIAAMNPCPCGNFGIKGKACICSPIQIERYKKKISGPIIDRIDLWTEVSRVDHDSLMNKRSGPSESKKLKEEITAAREIQKNRFRKMNKKINLNSEMSARDLVECVSLGTKEKETLKKAAQSLDLSARGYHRVVKIARTIADLEGVENIKENHIMEALQYRPRRES